VFEEYCVKKVFGYSYNLSSENASVQRPEKHLNITLAVK